MMNHGGSGLKNSNHDGDGDDDNICPYLLHTVHFPCSLLYDICWRCMWGRVYHPGCHTLGWVLTMVPGQRWRVQDCVWVQAQVPHHGTSASIASQSSQWRRWWNFWEPQIKIQILWSVSQMSSTRTWCSVVVRLSHRICIETGFPNECIVT